MEEKIIVLNTENEKLKKLSEIFTMKFIESATACEELQEMYSNISKECIKFKKSESEIFDKYVIACQEKERVLVDSEMQFAHLKMKIKLLEEVLTKRNQECKEITKKSNV